MVNLETVLVPFPRLRGGLDPFAGACVCIRLLAGLCEYDDLLAEFSFVDELNITFSSA